MKKTGRLWAARRNCKFRGQHTKLLIPTPKCRKGSTRVECRAVRIRSTVPKNLQAQCIQIGFGAGYSGLNKDTHRKVRHGSWHRLRHDQCVELVATDRFLGHCLFHEELGSRSLATWGEGVAGTREDVPRFLGVIVKHAARLIPRSYPVASRESPASE